MNDKKSFGNLRLSKGEAIKILIRIRYAKKPQKFEKIIKLINSLDNKYPIPPSLKKKLKKDIPCLILLNHFINPLFYTNSTDELINLKVSLLTEMVTRIQTVCHRSPTIDIFWSFVKNIISYFRDPTQYKPLHKFFSSITKSQEEMKFLLSFTKEDILYSPIEISHPKLHESKELRDDYINFLQLIGIDTTPIDFKYVYKKPKVEKPLKTYFNVREDFTDLTTLPLVSYSYRDKSFLMEECKISNTTPFIDMIANHRYISISTDPIASTASVPSSQPLNRSASAEKENNNSNSSEKNEETNINFDFEIAYLSFQTSDNLHKQEYRMGLLEMSFFELRNHFSFSNEIIEKILSENDNQLDSVTPESNGNAKIKFKSKSIDKSKNFNKIDDQLNSEFDDITNDKDNSKNIPLNASPNLNVSSNMNGTHIYKAIDFDNNQNDLNNLNNTISNNRCLPFYMQDHWRVYRTLSIIYNRTNALPVERIFRSTYDNGNYQQTSNDISNKVAKIMRHILIALIKMKINWYHSQCQAYIEYSFSKPRFFPHPEYCEISITDIENYNSKNAPETADFISNLSNFIMTAYTNPQEQKHKKKKGQLIENSNAVLMDRQTIDLLTLFSQYYKYFICYYFYPHYILPPLCLLNAATKWKYIYYSEMKEIIGLSGIEESEELAKMFYNESIRKMLVEEEAFIVKRDYNRNETASPKLVVAQFFRENNGCGDSFNDAINVKVSPANRNNVLGVMKKISAPKSWQNNNSPKHHKK